jgi:monoamine oxidase
MYFCNRYYGAQELARDFQVLAPLLQQQAQEVGFPTTHAHFTEAGYRLDHRPLQGSSKIAGGNEQLPLAIARSLPEDCIHLRHQLIALERNRDDSLILTFATAGGSSEVQCERAIRTLPFSTLRRVDYRRAERSRFCATGGLFHDCRIGERPGLCSELPAAIGACLPRY